MRWKPDWPGGWERRPGRAIRVGIALTGLLTVLMGWVAWRAHRTLDELQRTSHELGETVRVRPLVRDRARALRRFVTTGDTAWAGEVARADSTLRAAMRPKRWRAHDPAARRAAAELLRANRELVQVEREAMRLAASGQRDEALRLLSSDAHADRAAALAGAVGRVTEMLLRDAAEGQEAFGRYTFLMLLLAVGGFSGLLAVGMTSLLRLRRYIESRDDAEEALRWSERRFRSLIEHSLDLIVVLDAEARVRYASPSVERILGYDVKEIEGERVLEYVHPDDLPHMLHSFQSRSTHEGTGALVEFRMRHRDGSWRVIEEVGTNRFDDPSVGGMVINARDVTDRKRLESIQREKEQAERANRAKTEFLSRMSHELRTPLNAILGFGQLLEADPTVEDVESVHHILKAGRHLLALVDEVLDLAKIEAGRMSLAIEPVAVRDAVLQGVDLVRPAAAEQRVSLDVRDAGTFGAHVAADRQRLRQVLLNLLSNAIKYNRPGGSVAVGCEQVGAERLRIVVRDTGCGIPADKLRRLFTPFDRIDADARGVQGTGLGLALSKGLVEAMGGALGVESVEGEGSTFWVELPAAAGADPTASERRPAGAGSARAGTDPGRTVLLVEDNLANVRLMERLVEHRPGVRLLVAMQGSLALDLAREHRPDLVFLDLDLPDLPGEQVLARLREDPALRDVPVIIVSADAQPSRIRRLLALGARDYITKPFDLQRLLGILNETLRDAEGGPGR